LPGPAELDESGAALWQASEEAWHDQARHDRFVQHAYVTGTLPAAAARYRARAVAQPDDAIATRMLARITFLATQQALRPAGPAPRPFTRSPLFLGVMVAGALLGAVIGLLGKGACEGPVHPPRLIWKAGR
jgi:hypothetical protein